ncbi:MAG TPA: pilus assembly protein N-terminal domain-containing protein [Bacillota bacterium]|nr:pilus assembly protein N-terminal domain-containing protein [Bacillota bacterium]
MRRMVASLFIFIIIALAFALPGHADQEPIFMTVGESKIFEYSGLTRVATSNPAVVDLVVTASSEVIANAKSSGLAFVHIWHEGKRSTFRIEVAEDYSPLAKEISEIINIPTVKVRVTAKTVVLEGSVPSDLDMARVTSIAKNYRDSVLNFLKIEKSYQVLITAMVTELKVDDIKDLGIEWGSMTIDGTQEVGGGLLLKYLFAGSQYDFVEKNGVFDQRRISPVGARLSYLFKKGTARVLAAPSILVQSGKSAQILVGGQIPIPIQTDKGIQVDWKDYGIKLEAKPNILDGDMIDMSVSPEVSSLDWSNAVIVSNMKIPAVATRRANTQLSIQSGSTLALGGLLSREDSKNIVKVPGLGNIPIIGELFKSRDYRSGLTELVIFITPYIVPVGKSPEVSKILPSGTSMPESQTTTPAPKGEK